MSESNTSNVQRLVGPVIVVAAFVFCCFMVFRTAMAFWERTGFFAPKIACPIALHDFGEVSPGAVCHCSFSVENHGDRPLLIDRVRVGCSSCLRIENTPPDSVLPGASKEIKVEFTSPGKVGVVVRAIQVFSNDPSNPHFALKIRAVVKEAGDKQMDQTNKSKSQGTDSKQGQALDPMRATARQRSVVALKS